MRVEQPAHVPVLLNEVIEWLQPQPGGRFADGTLGAGGHTAALAEGVGPTGLVVATDRDPAAVATARARFGESRQVRVVIADYCSLGEILADLDPTAALDGIVLDLGLSSDQLADPRRGFSFNTDGELDLRFDATAGEPAWRLIQRLPEKALADLIYRFGEERHSRRIARRIVAAREDGPIHTADRLAAIVRASVPRTRDSLRIDPATRTFQALRIAVNDELESLRRALVTFPDSLRHGGRLAIISFHSLEDRLVKWAFREDPRYEPLTKKPIMAGEAELARNPRARSAKLRVAARTGHRDRTV
jgi:16S rRNA (cytosine1402-N4)-methyltransferase